MGPLRGSVAFPAPLLEKPLAQIKHGRRAFTMYGHAVPVYRNTQERWSSLAEDPHADLGPPTHTGPESAKQTDGC